MIEVELQPVERGHVVCEGVSKDSTSWHQIYWWSKVVEDNWVNILWKSLILDENQFLQGNMINMNSNWIGHISKQFHT